MQGYVNATLFNAGQLTDADFAQARKEGCINEVIDSQDVAFECEGKNQIIWPYQTVLLERIFNASNDNGVLSGQRRPADGHYFAITYLASTGTQRAWDDPYPRDYFPVSASDDMVTSDAYKRFRTVATDGAVEEARVSEEANTPTGLRAIRVSHSWLWLTQEAVSSQIRSVIVWGSESGTRENTGNDYRQYTMMHRFVDGTGTPITVSKTNTQTFMVRWTQTFKSI